jgi:hypothetical protein
LHKVFNASIQEVTIKNIPFYNFILKIWVFGSLFSTSTGALLSMRVAQMKSVRSAASKYGQSQTTAWLCAWHTSSQPQAAQQNGFIRAIGNSVTWLNASAMQNPSKQGQWSVI